MNRKQARERRERERERERREKMYIIHEDDASNKNLVKTKVELRSRTVKGRKMYFIQVAEVG
jgi:hypothetical protein